MVGALPWLPTENQNQLMSPQRLSVRIEETYRPDFLPHQFVAKICPVGIDQVRRKGLSSERRDDGARRGGAQDKLPPRRDIKALVPSAVSRAIGRVGDNRGKLLA